ncbi:hypothetical protein LT493_29480 [Streptomyces tricolor]|nr:hypothetical protein [Streptomyces tricolor]
MEAVRSCAAPRVRRAGAVAGRTRPAGTALGLLRGTGPGAAGTGGSAVAALRLPGASGLHGTRRPGARPAPVGARVALGPLGPPVAQALPASLVLRCALGVSLRAGGGGGGSRVGLCGSRPPGFPGPSADSGLFGATPSFGCCGCGSSLMSCTDSCFASYVPVRLVRFCAPPV